MGERSCPTLDGTMGTIECRLFREYDGGDHVIVLGAVEAITLRPDREPLVYFRGDLFSLEHLAQATAGKSQTCREAPTRLSR